MELKITLYSHFFKVTHIQARAMPCINRFCMRYGIKQWVKENRRNVLKVTKVFAVRTLNHKEYRFHKGQLADFYKALENDGITASQYTVTEHPSYVPLEVNPQVKAGWVLRDYQQAAHDFIIQEDEDDNCSRLVAIPTGGGKALSLNSLIKVPNGWERMRDMQVGTEVIAKDGSTTTVTGVYPQPFQPIYRVTFKDGRSTECCGEHLWKIYITNKTNKHLVINTYAVQALLDKRSLKKRIYIDLCDSEQNRDQDLPMDPYALGVTLHHDPSDDKAIPCLYLSGSTAQRLAVLQGLLDTEATVRKNRHIVYSTLSEELALGIQYLVRSLGGMARVSSTVPIIHCKAGPRMYHVDIYHTQPEALFTVSKKKAQVRNNNPRPSALKLRVESIEIVEHNYAQCISIAHPDQLYVTDDFIVTHNTVTALMCTQTLKHATMIIVLSGYVDKWVADIEKTVEVKRGDIIIVQGSKSMKDLTYCENTAKYIIVSLNTIKNYFKTYEKNPSHIEDEGYAYPPEALCERLQIGTIIIDEVHQHLHAVYKLLTYTHVPKVVALSATLISDDPLIKQIQHQMFPKEIRFDSVKMEQYIHCYSTSYFFKDLAKDKIRTTEFGSNSYSHNAFEKSILKRPQVLHNYISLIDNLINLGYIEHYQRGDKAAVYVSSVAMADAVTEWLKHKYPDLDVRRYVEQDPYENVIDADIRVTTVLSAGTAIDIPNLVTVIMTINLKSSVFNLQTLGRLRKIPNRIVRFYWVFCSQVPKHYEFHQHRKAIFQDRVESIKEFHYPYGL